MASPAADDTLPARWAGRERFVVVATRFGFGHEFLALWQAWREDPARCRQLVCVVLEPSPPSHVGLARAHAVSPRPAPVVQLLAAWPPLTAGLHLLDFEDGRVCLMLGIGTVAELLPTLHLQADGWRLDAADAIDPRGARTLARLSAPDACLAARGSTAAWRDGLAAAGFVVDDVAADGSTAARWAPRFVPRARQAPAVPAERRALVVGAGLAGACTARALAEEGWSVTVLDRHVTPAAEASGNSAGLFHGTVHAGDGLHARLFRSAALYAQRVVAAAVAAGVPGSAQGLLRLGGDITAMRGQIAAQQLPADWVQALDTAEASARASVPLSGPAWFYPGGGWVSPAALVAHLLQGLPFVGSTAVCRIERVAGGWCVLDAHGQVTASAPVLVLAPGADADNLLAGAGLAGWPLQRQRGQVSGWTGAPVPLRLPVAGAGYAIPLPSGGLLCGATAADSAESQVRQDDHRHNFDRLAHLTGLRPPADGRGWFGRVGWRVLAADRLPVAGPVPLANFAAGTRLDQVRGVPRCDGLYVCAALGGRGITLAPLLGRLLAAQIARGPLPLPQALVDAVDPARWVVRAARRAA